MFLKFYNRASSLQYLCFTATDQWLLATTKKAAGRRGLALKAGVAGALQEFYDEPENDVPHTLIKSEDRTHAKKPPEIRKVLSTAHNPVADYIRKNGEDKSVYNCLLKDKGLWSYDWRISLAELEKSFNSDTCRDQWDAIKGRAGREVRRVPLRNIRADQIPKPTIWTARAFFPYVWNLVTSSVDRLVARKMYGKGQTHITTVAAILEDLFQDVALRKSITVGSCNIALEFMTKHSMFRQAQKLFERMQQLQLDTDASTFNILLEGAAHEKDLYNYTFILKMMISYGVSPDSQTWLHFVNTVPEDQPRGEIVKSMRKRGLLKHQSVRNDTVTSVIRYELASHLKSGQDLSSFLNDFDNQWGSDWMSVKAGEKILDEIRHWGSVTDTIAALQLLCDRGFKPNGPTLLLLLKQNSYSRDHGLSAELLHLFRTKYGVKPSEQVYDVLFAQAWRSQLYNYCRVLWSHACVRGVASFHMQERVKASLFAENYPPPDPASRWKVWFSTAGKVIAGHGSNRSISAFARLMSMLQPSEEKFRKSIFRQAVRDILADDLNLSGKYYTRQFLDELLFEAWRKDRQWSLGRALKEAPILCKYGQIIDVELEAGSSKRMVQSSDSGLMGLASGAALDQQSEEQNQECEMSAEMRSRACTCRIATMGSTQASPGQSSRKLEALG